MWGIVFTVVAYAWFMRMMHELDEKKGNFLNRLIKKYNLVMDYEIESEKSKKYESSNCVVGNLRCSIIGRKS